MTTTRTRTDPIDELVATLVAHIETHQAEWQRPWTQMIATVRPATNATTGAAYRGGNAVRLTIEALVNGWEGNQWATYRQWQTAGVQVQRGERGTAAVRWGMTCHCEPCGHRGPDRCAVDGHDNEFRMWAVGFRLFEQTQTDASGNYAPVEASGTAQDLVAAIPADIRERDSNRAFYDPAGDFVVMPQRHQFNDLEAFYGTLFHELTHWTGHVDRLNRPTGAVFGDAAYAAEELTAELGAAFVGQRCGLVPNDQRHAAYLGSWLRTLGETPAHLYKVMTHAQAAADHLTSYATAPD